MELLKAKEKELEDNLKIENDNDKRSILFNSLYLIGKEINVVKDMLLADKDMLLADKYQVIKGLSEKTTCVSINHSYMPSPPPSLRSDVKAFFKRSKLSASQIANKQGGYCLLAGFSFVMFSSVCNAGLFIPNERIRQLVRKCKDQSNTNNTTTRAIELAWELNHYLTLLKHFDR